MRKTIFATGEYYHIYNRGVDKRQIFQDDRDYLRFFETLYLSNDNKDGLMLFWRDYQRVHPRAKLLEVQELSSRREYLVEVIAYCFNPNHYHFLLKQTINNGIKRFMHKLGTSYTNYFNKKYDRAGSLFQGPFKSTHIKSNELLLHLSSYVNCNSEIHKIAKAKKYRWCSFPDYIGFREKGIVQKNIILDQFGKNVKYERFAEEYIEYFQKRKIDEKTLFE